MSRRVTITLELPDDIAEEVERVHGHAPEFLERVVRYALTRRTIYDGIQKRRIADNRHHDGGAWAEARGGRDAST